MAFKRLRKKWKNLDFILYEKHIQKEKSEKKEKKKINEWKIISTDISHF